MPKEILSPLPGTFYRRPAPDKPPFKADGDVVAVGDVVGLIEVMKSFIEVHADAAARSSGSWSRTKSRSWRASRCSRSSKMAISRLLIANRGEIAVRIQRAARELGIRTIQVHSAADAELLAVRMADEAVNIGPPQAGQILSEHRGHSRAPPPPPAPTRSIPATASCRRTPTSRRRSSARA